MSLGFDEVKPADLAQQQGGRRDVKHPQTTLLSVHNEFSSVQAIWRQFEKTADCFAFQTFDFLESWYEHIGHRSSIDLQIVVAWGTDAVPLMILPLGIEKAGFARKLTWLGGDVTDYNAPLLAPAFAEHVKPGEFSRLWTDILAAIPAHDWVELLYQPALIDNQANPFMELPAHLNASGAHMTLLGGDFEKFYKGKRSSKARSHLRNRRKKLEALGEVTFVYPDTQADISASVENLIQLKTASLNAMGVRNFLADPGYGEFYKLLAEKLSGPSDVHVCHLEVGGKYVAGIWGLVHRKRFYYLLASYDGAGFGRFKPGVQTLVETMRWATDQGIEVFDFTVGDESYKGTWCEMHIDLHNHLSANTVRGALAAMRARGFLAAKRKIKQTPLLWDNFTKLRSRFLSR